VALLDDTLYEQCALRQLATFSEATQAIDKKGLIQPGALVGLIGVGVYCPLANQGGGGIFLELHRTGNVLKSNVLAFKRDQCIFGGSFFVVVILVGPLYFLGVHENVL
jgi:hypothetical protein